MDQKVIILFKLWPQVMICFKTPEREHSNLNNVLEKITSQYILNTRLIWEKKAYKLFYILNLWVFHLISRF